MLQYKNMKYQFTYFAMKKFSNHNLMNASALLNKFKEKRKQS